jgi:hypothetical protein
MPTHTNAPGFRVSYFYQDVERKSYGWSENLFHPGPDRSTATTAAQELLGPAVNMHAANVTCTFMRITDLTNFRLQKLFQVNRVPPQTTDPKFKTNFVADSYLISFLGSDGRRVRNWFRGIPDYTVGDGGKVVEGFGFINPFIAAVAKNGFCLRGLPRPQSYLQLTAWAQDTGILTVPGHGLTTPARVRVKGVRTLYPRTFNRVFKVTMVDANTLQIVSWSPIAPPTPLDLTNATVAEQYQVNTSIVGLPTTNTEGTEVAGVTGHKTGRPFNLAVGKQKGRRRPAPGVLVAS